MWLLQLVGNVRKKNELTVNREKWKEEEEILCPIRLKMGNANVRPSEKKKTNEERDWFALVSESNYLNTHNRAQFE